MIHLPASVRVYLCLAPADMRRSFDGLHALVRDHLQLDAFAGHLYIFSNRRKDRLKGTATASRFGRSAWRKARSRFPRESPVRLASRSRRKSWVRC